MNKKKKKKMKKKMMKRMRSNSGTYQPFCCISYPRSGTHLLSDIVQVITGLTCYWPETTLFSDNVLDNIPNNQFYINHPFPNPASLFFLSNNKYKIILNIRDPRDQLMSHYFYYAEMEKGGDNEWGHFLKKFNKEEAIHTLITTLETGGWGCPLKLAGWLTQWMDAARLGVPILLVTYEKLIQNKAAAVTQIAHFLEYNLSPDKVEKIVKETAFDQPSKTIKHNGEHENAIKRKGIVGEWSNHFTQSNKDAFKAVGGKLLIELGYEKDLDW